VPFLGIEKFYIRAEAFIYGVVIPCATSLTSTWASGRGLEPRSWPHSSMAPLTSLLVH